MELELIGRLIASGISLKDASMYFDYDTEESFITTLQSNIPDAYQIWINKQKKGDSIPFTDSEKKDALQHIKDVEKSPERLNRLMINQIVAWALSTGPIKDIIAATGKTESELDLIIQKKFGKNFKEFLEQYHAKARLAIREGLFTRGTSGDSKTLQFLAEKLVEEMKVEKPTTVVNIDNRSVKYVELPKPEKLEDYSKYWDKPELPKE